MRKHIIWSYDKNLLQEVLDNSISYNDLFNKLNLTTSKSLIKMLQYRIKIENISRIKFIDNTKKNKRSQGFNCKPISEILVENSTYVSTTNLKNKLIKYDLLKYKCEICQIDEWNGSDLTLQLDHINGISNDNRLENLRLLCPNCHSQTDTYAGKKKKNRKKKLKNCQSCGIEVENKIFCHECDAKIKLKRRKVNRPSKEELIELVNKFGYSATGRKFGVSDNSIRKWLK